MSVRIEVPPGRTADLDGPVHYVEWDGPPGRTFVLVHGLGGSHLSWLAVAPGLARHGRVLALDLPGFGRSPLAGRRSRLSYQRAVVSRFVAEVAGEPAVLVGNSMGGGIAMLQAALEPDSIRGLVLSNSVFPWTRGAWPAPIVMLGFGLYQVPGLGEWVARKRLTALDAERVVRIGLRILCHDAARVPEELVRLHVDLIVEHQADPDAAPAFLEAARSLIALGRRPDLARWVLDHVRAPVLVIHGREDGLVPVRAAQAVLEGRPGWDVRLLPRVGHVPQMEAPDRWLATVEGWLEDALEPADAPRGRAGSERRSGGRPRSLA